MQPKELSFLPGYSNPNLEKLIRIKLMEVLKTFTNKVINGFGMGLGMGMALQIQRQFIVPQPQSVPTLRDEQVAFNNTPTQESLRLGEDRSLI